MVDFNKLAQFCGRYTDVMIPRKTHYIHVCRLLKGHGPEIDSPIPGFDSVQQHRCLCGAEWTDPHPWVKSI